jgi:DNA repair protein RecN (Recombination protein N)
MLLELHVRDFAIIQAARLSLGPGLTVLTGETGAGKSILVDAVALLLGARGDPGMVRAGADRAVIQGVFAEPSEDVRALLEEIGAPAEPGEPLIVDREVHAAGRSVARVCGHTVTARDLARLAAMLVDLHGQSDTASLRRESDQLDLVDRYAGLEAERAAFAELVDRLRAVEDESRALQTDDAARARRADMLAFQIAEIREARLGTQEETELGQERLRLANAEKLAQLSAAAAAALAGSADEQAAVDYLERAADVLADLAGIDAEVGPLRDALMEATEAARDVARQVASYRDGLEFQPGRLDEVEARTAVYADLKR